MEVGKYLLLQNDDANRGEIQAPIKICIDKPKIILGKGSPKMPVDVVISALKNEKEIISRRHAEMIILDNGECIINDLGALNGIFVNNIKVNSHKLLDGDIIQFGGLCNQTVGSSLDKSDVSLRYLFRVEPTNDDTKRKSPESRESYASSSVSKRSKVAVDSLHNIVSPPLVNAKASSSPSDSATLAKLKAELKHAQNNFSLQIDQLKQERQLTEAALKKEITNLKAQSGLQLETINVRDAGLKSARLQSKQLEEQLRSLELKIAATERQLADQVQKNQSLQMTLENANNKSKERSAPVQCGISNSTLEASISCPLCEQLLVEAVVLQCSHGYCRACIEQHWHASVRAQGRSPSSSSAAQGVTCRCPRCNAVSGSRGQRANLSPKAGNSGCYVRSDHLDALTWLIVEAGSATAREKFERREAQHRRDLQAMGIDPDLVPSNDPCDEPEPDPSSIAAGSSKKISVASSAEKHAFCDYCGGSGHAEEDCPHRMHEVAESTSEDEGSETNSDGDEDM